MQTSLLAIDIGNTRIKLGLFDDTGTGWPTCREFMALPRSGPVPWATIERWGNGHPLPAVFGGSHPAIVEQWQRAWISHRWPDPLVIRNRERIPVEVDVDFPDRVGLDRLLNAVAIHPLRQTNRSAIIVDAGTAITVDVVNHAGTFCGGAILPGLALSARALHEYTALLPLIGPEALRTAEPSPIGRNTEAAMLSGLRYGFLGAVRQLVSEQQRLFATEPQLFLTGGDGPLIATEFPSAQLVPSLAMYGLVLCHRETRP